MNDEPQVSVWTQRNLESWETVDHFKVNKWMLKLGAVWTVSEKKLKLGATGIGDQWELDGMIITQKDASKWYLATHKKHHWWQVWR